MQSNKGLIVKPTDKMEWNFLSCAPGSEISKELNAAFSESFISDTNGNVGTPISQCFHFSLNCCQIITK